MFRPEYEGGSNPIEFASVDFCDESITTWSQLEESARGGNWRTRLKESEGRVGRRSRLKKSAGGVGWRTRLKKLVGGLS